MGQLTKEQAIIFYNNKSYEHMTMRDIAAFQLDQDRLCVPFSLFHEALEKTLNRPVYTHELLDKVRLRQELGGFCRPPSFEEIMAMIPQEKPIVIGLSQDAGETK